MKPSLLTLLVLSVISGIEIGINSETVKCDYKEEPNEDWSMKSDKFYKCHFTIVNSTLTSIQGDHQVGKNDSDVTYVTNNSSDGLKRFSSIFCDAFENVEVFLLTDKSIESVAEDSLEKCTNLKYLSISNTQLRELPQNWLNSSQLDVCLIFENPQLTSIPEGLFATQKNIWSVNLSINKKISFLPDNLFGSLKKLINLNLYSNQLTAINPKWFEKLVSLSYVSLGSNQITEVPSKSFKHQRKLKMLYLERNQIKTLHPDSFFGLTRLQELSMYENKISELPIGVFGPLKNLKDLWLYSNNLKVIHAASFGVLRSLENIFMYQNEIEAIDARIMDNTAVTKFQLTDNICVDELLETRHEIRSELENCFEQYERMHATTNTVPCTTEKVADVCGRTQTVHSNVYGGSFISRGDFPW